MKHGHNFSLLLMYFTPTKSEFKHIIERAFDDHHILVLQGFGYFEDTQYFLSETQVYSYGAIC